MRLVASSLLAVVVGCASGAPNAQPPKPHTYDARDVWLSSPVIVGGPILFADEQLPLVDAVAGALQKQGFRAIGNAEVRAEWRSLQSGHLPDGRVCAAVPPPSLFTAATRPGASQADTRVECEAGVCTLSVIVEKRVDDEPQEVARFTAKLPADAASWPKTLQATGLTRVAPPQDEGGFGLGGIAAQKITLLSVRTNGTWVQPIDESLFEPHYAALASCSDGKPRWRDWWSQPFVLQVDAQGKIERCEPEMPDHLPPPSFACVCDVMRGMSFGAGSASRRATFDLLVFRARPASVADKYRRDVSLSKKQADDRTAILGSGVLDDDAARACLGGVEPFGPIEVPVRFEVDAQGKVREHAVVLPAGLPAVSTQCLHAQLAAAQFDCPVSGRATVTATLELTVAPW